MPFIKQLVIRSLLTGVTAGYKKKKDTAAAAFYGS